MKALRLDLRLEGNYKLETIRILYVDDNIDNYISEYLSEQYECEGMVKEYDERPFDTEDSYETLLQDSRLHMADIIIIDSVLFENANFTNEKLAGEEFEVILKKVFPFKEVIVVSQNDFDDEYQIIKKYDSSSRGDKQLFFEENWKPILDRAASKVVLYRKMLKRIEEKDYVEKYFLEGMQQSIVGESGYDKLTVEDIDKLIAAFESVRKDYD